MERINKISYLLWVLLLISACADFSPKPMAYSRVIYPVKEYKTIDVDCPFEFEIPTYSELMHYEGASCWYNLEYTPFNATLHLSYIPINSPSGLDSLVEDAYRLVFKPHLQVAEEIIERELTDTSQGTFGMIYDLQGKTATPFNFYITDGKEHFLRGAFYFNEKTFRDSILPIYDFLNEDIIRSIETVRFK